MSVVDVISQITTNQFWECTPPQAQVDLDINNVRARIIAGGDMWWDITNDAFQAAYEVPKGSGLHSMYNGGLWVAAMDPGGQLHVAAATYRSRGYDFASGPLDTVSRNIYDPQCAAYDKVWKVNRSDVEQFKLFYNDPSYTIPDDILTWPGNGVATSRQAKFLAPFRDLNGNGLYEPLQGEYPDFDFEGTPYCDHQLLGDQSLWWVFNDKGKTHTLSGGTGMGLEVHGTAFAFHRGVPELEEATFLRYKLINRSSQAWLNTYVGLHTHNRIGAPYDEYTGCDVGRSMVYVYNGHVIDGFQNFPGYGARPPAIGMDFMQGPKADENDGRDNDRDFIVDEPGERINMTMYRDVPSGPFFYEEAEVDPEFYWAMQGLWIDQTPQTYGGFGISGTVPAMFMYPGDTDPWGFGTNGNIMPYWSSPSSYSNNGSQTLSLQSMGPFTMEPGEVEVITLGLPWAREDFQPLMDKRPELCRIDDSLQLWFDRCFSNLPCSSDETPSIYVNAHNGTVFCSTSLSEATVTWDFGDGTTVIGNVVKHEYNESGWYNVCATFTSDCFNGVVCDSMLIIVHNEVCGPNIKRIEGAGSGTHILRWTRASEDALFAGSDAINKHPEYPAGFAPITVEYEDYHALQNGVYRIALDSSLPAISWKFWKVGTVDTIFSDPSIPPGVKQRIPQYGLAVTVTQSQSPGFNRNTQNGWLPSRMVFQDPSKAWLTGVQDADDRNEKNWIRSGTNTGSGSCIAEFRDYFINSQPIDPDEWYENYHNGTWAPYKVGADHPYPSTNYCYINGPRFPNVVTNNNNFIENTPNVDVVITSDRSRWSRCVVFESGHNPGWNMGNKTAFELRFHPSVDKDGRTVAEGGLSDPNNPEAADYIGAMGMSWFPGYAVNLETGERLNIAFAENTALGMENGTDLMWNPTSHLETNIGVAMWGGMHYIYVFNHNGDAVYTSGVLAGQLKDVPRYDAGKMMHTILTSSVALNERTEIFRDAVWVGIPMLIPGRNLLETDVRVELRMQQPLRKFNPGVTPENNFNPLYEFSIDKSSICCNIYTGSVQVYPNPFVDECVIQFENLLEEPYQLLLYDVRGRLVRDVQGITKDRYTVSSEGLNSGVYVYVLTNNKDIVHKGRIVLR